MTELELIMIRNKEAEETANREKKYEDDLFASIHENYLKQRLARAVEETVDSVVAEAVGAVDGVPANDVLTADRVLDKIAKPVVYMVAGAVLATGLMMFSKGGVAGKTVTMSAIGIADAVMAGLSVYLLNKCRTFSAKLFIGCTVVSNFAALMTALIYLVNRGW